MSADGRQWRPALPLLAPPLAPRIDQETPEPTKSLLRNEQPAAQRQQQIQPDDDKKENKKE
jgi:hypothetical protein